MAMPVQEQRRKVRQKFRADLLRLFVLYPVAWIVVSVMLFYLVTKNQQQKINLSAPSGTVYPLIIAQPVELSFMFPGIVKSGAIMQDIVADQALARLQRGAVDIRRG